MKNPLQIDLADPRCHPPFGLGNAFPGPVDLVLRPERSQRGRRRVCSTVHGAMNQVSESNGLERVFVDQRCRLLRFIQARGAGDDAEDVLHDLWQRVIGQISRPIGDPVSYLFRSVENLIVDRRRSESSRERRQQDWYEASVAPHEEASGERALIARQRLQAVERALNRLGPRAHQVFRRVRLDGVSQAAVARELGVSLSSVEKDLHKAHCALSELRARFDAE